MKGGGSYVPPGYVPAPDEDSSGPEISVLAEHRNVNRSGRYPSEHWTSGICACFDDLPSCTYFTCCCVSPAFNKSCLSLSEWMFSNNTVSLSQV